MFTLHYERKKRRDGSLTIKGGVLPDFQSTSICSFTLMLRAEGEETNTNVIAFGLTRSRLEPMIYHTQGEHAGHL
jgi:hypothetical protein